MFDLNLPLLLPLAAAPAAELAVLRDFLIIMASSAIIAVAMQRLRLAVIPAYLITGAIIGPSALGFISSAESLGAISNLAIVLLLFGIGLHLDLQVLRHGLVRMLVISIGSITLSAVVGWPVAIAFGLSSPAALIVAMGLSLSSTAVVLRIYAARRQLQTTPGRLALSILVVQDLAVMGMLASIPLLALWQRELLGLVPAEAIDPDVAPLTALELIARGLGRLAAIALLIIGGRLLLPRLLREAARSGAGEILMLVSVAAALGAALVTQALGFSMELGAFLAGFLLSSTRFRYQISGQIAPLRDLFMAVFFTALGSKLDVAILSDAWWIILLGGAIMSAIKVGAIGGMAWAFGATPAIALLVALSLAQAGEFSLIVFDTAFTAGLLTNDTLAVLISTVVLSLIITPMLYWSGRKAADLTRGMKTAPWFRRPALDVEPIPGEAGPEGHGALTGPHAVIAGFGPTGRQLADMLGRAGVSHTVIELNPDTVERETRAGRSIVYGDASNVEVLEKAGLGHADALLLTIPDDDAVRRACSVAREISPSIFIVARTHNVSNEAAVAALGADQVIVDEKVTAQALERIVADRFLVNGALADVS